LIKLDKSYSVAVLPDDADLYQRPYPSENATDKEGKKSEQELCDASLNITRVEVVATERTEKNAEKNVGEAAAATDVQRDGGCGRFIVAREIERPRRR
jgi:hypothetical protein